MQIATTFKFSREEAERILAEFVLEFHADSNDLSSGVCWNYTEEGDLDSITVSVYTDEA